MEFDLKLINWNIGGAKYLETPKPNVRDMMRDGLQHLIAQRQPHLICLQEFTQFSDNAGTILDVIECPPQYERYHVPLIDTVRHSHQGKWNNVRERGKWPVQTYFSQGNAIFVRKDLRVFPVWSLPTCEITFGQWRAERLHHTSTDDHNDEAPLTADDPLPEDIILQTGFYRGTRDTEPRAATVLHLVIDRPLTFSMDDPPRRPFPRPLDLFVVNTHLTTLTREREGIPAVDAKASQRRIGQLDILFDDVISEYNLWTKDDYRIRGRHVPPLASETHDRYPPLWMLCGDFNFTRESGEYRYISSRNFIDLDFSVPASPTKAVGLGKDPSLTLDYVFAGPAYESLDPQFTRSRAQHHVHRAEPVQVSDHYPIDVTLTVNVPEKIPARCKKCEPKE